MVLDSAKGIEPQTLKLFEVCRLRDLPILTFCNKMDREARDTFEIIDEIQENLDNMALLVENRIGSFCMDKRYIRNDGSIEELERDWDAFLAVVQEPRYRRIVIQEGPVVLGYERYREQEERSTFGIVQEIVSSVLETYDLEPSMVETFSRVFFGAWVTIEDEDGSESTWRIVRAVTVIRPDFWRRMASL